ncbi:cellulose biosynthesis protein [Neoasaia chiangmaiensis NBRC 101099]|uniref:Uncharacterized protein n=1 Tax=Neoasaia chiangmaiensis TaxID=320497 RepID=A0A1U9KS21_9PROT|nr:cellulose biosynthesis protein BcsD [Neoasaia chiangmaiensis]AQS88509.1 hypothetical protein A0U93_11825 [Neoasaia chiangmaiensis]GBR36448.1 cellulose biosynthesis protein [Neoasaia chiangmaiensis NBRC 101099]GEN15338.1 hypothetical protein NCH01_17690 [Neoasaia chiangmaiensis]
MSADFSFFLHALATEFDAQAGVKARDHLLRAVGHRMAQRLPLPECRTLEALEMESNALLAFLGWGKARITVSTQPRGLIVSLVDCPTVGALGEPAGYWLGCSIGGLYEIWLKNAEHDQEVDWTSKIQKGVDASASGALSILLEAQRRE